MDKPLKPYIFDESNGLWYQLQGDYYIPCLVLPQEDISYQLGKYGHMRQDFLKEHRPALYNELLLSCKLFSHLAEIDRNCKERMEIICTAMAEQEGVTEALKASDQMEWGERVPVALKLRTDRAGRRDWRKNSIHNRAEEIVLRELVYDS